MTVTMHDNPYCWNFHTCSTLRNKELHLQARALTKKRYILQFRHFCFVIFHMCKLCPESKPITHLRCPFCPRNIVETSFIIVISFFFYYYYFFFTIIYCPSHSTAFSNFFPKPRFLTCSYLLQETERPTIPQAFKNTWEFWTFPHSVSTNFPHF